MDYTDYDILPRYFKNYIRYYGKHFNKKLCEFACAKLKESSYTKESLRINEINTEDNYDAVYLANWCKSRLFGSSIPDEKHLMLFIKDILSKEKDLIFNRWYADMAKLGISIDWEEMI